MPSIPHDGSVCFCPDIKKLHISTEDVELECVFEEAGNSSFIDAD
jgi:hypothetical protein